MHLGHLGHVQVAREVKTTGALWAAIGQEGCQTWVLAVCYTYGTPGLGVIAVE